MTHEDEYDNFIGGDPINDPPEADEFTELCRRCNSWPCRCAEDLANEDFVFEDYWPEDEL
jgi:hypothetical protein